MDEEILDEEILNDMSGSIECPGCGNTIHPERYAAGYGTCIGCSTTKKYGYIYKFDGKTADGIEIVEDAELAEKIRKKQGGKHGQI